MNETCLSTASPSFPYGNSKTEADVWDSALAIYLLKRELHFLSAACRVHSALRKVIFYDFTFFH